MIVHLSAAGVPVSWSIVALYKSAYGIAHKAAETWHARSIRPAGEPLRYGGTREKPEDEPQFLVEFDGNDDKGWTIKRSELWMDDSHRTRQSPDDGTWLVQTHTAPLPISEALGKAITDTLRGALVEWGYLIPRAEWRRRYPKQAMTSDRFVEFSAAHKAARDAGEELAFEPKWTLFMERPAGMHLPYSNGFLSPDGALDEHDRGGFTPVVVTRPDERSAWERFEDPELPPIASAKDAQDAARLLNSGWSPAEVATIFRDEPVD